MLIAPRNTHQRSGDQASLQVAGGNKILGGGIVMLNPTGFAVKGQTAANLTYVGVAEATVDNLAGADGVKTVLVRRKRAFKFNNLASDAITQADLFKTAYVVDDETVAKTSGGNTRSVAGKIIDIAPDGVWIEG